MKDIYLLANRNKEFNQIKSQISDNTSTVMAQDKKT